MNTVPVRRTVLEGVMNSLKAISIANGYMTTPTQVLMTGIAPQVFQAPILCVHERSGSTVELLTHDPSWLHRVYFRVHAIAIGKGQGEREVSLADLVDDVLTRLLKEDERLDDTVDFVEQLEGDDTDEGAGQTVGEAVLDFVARITTGGEDMPPLTFTAERLGTLLPEDVWITALGPFDLLTYPNRTLTVRNLGPATITDGEFQATPASLTAADEAWEIVDGTTFKDLGVGEIKSYTAMESSRRFVRLRLRTSFPAGSVVDAWMTANRT